MADILCKLNNEDIIFDNEPYLFAFNNKIFDLKQSKFIDPEPEQYISLTTGYNYIEQNEKENIKLVEDLIDSILRQPELKKLYLTIISTGMDGINLEKFIIANGGGGNGKSLLNELLESMLGNYCYILPSQVLTAPLKSGPNPDVANMNNIRTAIFREPDATQKFNMPVVKDLTGSDQTNARKNYSNEGKVNLRCTLIGELNVRPILSEINDAVSRRLIDIPFKSKFVDKYEYDELDEEDKKIVGIKNDYYKTKEFKNKYRQALFLILVKYHREFLNNNRILPMCDEVMKRNQAYMKKSDEFLSWFEDSYEKTVNKKDTIKLKDVFNNFKTSDYFTNLNKLDKRNNNYKNFNEKLENNIFLKKFITENKDKIKIITNYIKKPEEPDTEDEDEKN
jgi:hypothetical protein